MFPPPPVQGLGTVGGFKLQLEDRGSVGYEQLYAATQALHGQGTQERLSWARRSRATRSTSRS
ncbi:hypothetical protein ACU4HD_44080 [Cupriavidus basilensis]